MLVAYLESHRARDRAQPFSPLINPSQLVHKLLVTFQLRDMKIVALMECFTSRIPLYGIKFVQAVL